ncbi:hypothetical protein HYV86_02900 [Candidatus Woesearchaeota archaeon]|nr:hypothetical protein [Candidatus Woesearchaeota archaeon]
MADRTLVVDHLKFSYEGLFNAEELYAVISTFFFEKGWDWNEKINQEQVTPNGKQIRLVFTPWKSSTDYYKLKVEIHLQMLDVRDVEIEQNGKNLQVQHGQIRMLIDGFIMSDRAGKWTGSPFYWFVGFMIEKYFFNRHVAKLEAWIKSDIDDLYTKIKNYLNVFKYTYRT